MSHRDQIKEELVKFMKGKEIESVLEVGAGPDKTFKNMYPYINWNCTDKELGQLMEDLSEFKDNEYDMIFSCHAFEHCENPIQALREFKRVAKKYVFIATPYPCYHQILGADEDHIFVLDKMQMERLYKYVGLEKYRIYNREVEDRTEQFWHVISIGAKKNE